MAGIFSDVDVHARSGNKNFMADTHQHLVVDQFTEFEGALIIRRTSFPMSFLGASRVGDTSNDSTRKIHCLVSKGPR